jgi:predicted amidohydrolase YtcJ
MGILYEKVQLTQELKRQIMIRQLVDMGITEHQDQSIYDLDYYTLRHLLAIQKLKF